MLHYFQDGKVTLTSSHCQNEGPGFKKSNETGRKWLNFAVLFWCDSAGQFLPWLRKLPWISPVWFRQSTGWLAMGPWHMVTPRSILPWLHPWAPSAGFSSRDSSGICQTQSHFCSSQINLLLQDRDASCSEIGEYHQNQGLLHYFPIISWASAQWIRGAG